MTNTGTPAAPASGSTPTETTPGASSIRRSADKTAAPRTVIAYTRVADPDGQRSIQAQRAELDAEIAFHGWTVAAWIDDPGQPGTTLERPGLTRALALLAHHQADALMACDVTRLARSTAVTRQLAAHDAAYGWQLVIVQDDRQPPLRGRPAPGA